jgi:ribosomal protein S15P/S13E
MTNKIHDFIEHDHKESCNLYELIDKVLEVEQYLKDKELSEYMWSLLPENHKQ